MKLKLFVLATLSTWSLISNAAVPPPEKLLPADTLGIFTIPDFARAKTSLGRWPLAQLWRDPEMKGFRDKFLEKFKTDVLTPLERELGIKFEDYAGLAQGQLTVAMTPKNGEDKTDQSFGWLLILDTRDKSDQLKKNLSDLRKKWVDSGKQIKTDKIRDIEFTTLIFDANDIDKVLKNVFRKDKSEKDASILSNEKGTNKIELMVGQVDSLLLVGNNSKALEKVLIRQAGGAVLALGEQPAFESSYSSQFREAVSYSWVNLEPITENLIKQAEEDAAGKATRQPFPLDKMLDALGLRSLKIAAFSFNDTPEGFIANLPLKVPEGDRKGLFKIVGIETKDANPPSFVPADTIKFNRWRVDGQKAWSALETTLVALSPQMGGVIKLIMETAGKDKDPDFDLRKALVANLGDDFILFQKSPKAINPADLASPPSLFLVGSPNADQIAGAIKTISSLIPSESGTVKEREFLGRKIYSMPLPSESGRQGERNLSFAASAGYVAFSSEPAMVEEYLRSSETKGKSLREVAGLNEAAQKVGGMSTGMFGYENSSEMTRVWLENLKQNADSFGNGNPLFANLPSDVTSQKNLQEWFDFSRLPSFDKISKYFSFSVCSGAVNAEAFTFKFYWPTPPQLQK
jgi:hypothetical protein